MIQVQKILSNFSPKAIVLSVNKVKGIFGKSLTNCRCIEITYDKSQDLFDLYAFNMNTNKSIEPFKEIRQKGIFIDDLQETIKELL